MSRTLRRLTAGLVAAAALTAMAPAADAACYIFELNGRYYRVCTPA